MYRFNAVSGHVDHLRNVIQKPGTYIRFDDLMGFEQFTLEIAGIFKLFINTNQTVAAGKVVIKEFKRFIFIEYFHPKYKFGNLHSIRVQVCAVNTLTGNLCSDIVFQLACPDRIFISFFEHFFHRLVKK